MASNYVISGRKYLSGPIILAEKDLESLDDVINQVTKIIDEDTKRSYREDCQNYVSEPRHSERDETDLVNLFKERYENEYVTKKELLLNISEHKSVRIESFSNAKFHTDVIGIQPLGFALDVEGQATKASLSLSESGLTVSVYPKDSETSERVFGLLLSWATDNKTKWYRHAWSLANPAHWWLAAILIAVLATTMTSTTYVESEKAVLIDTAKLLLADGLTERESIKALEILLTLNTGNFKPIVIKKEIKPAFYLYLCFILLISILLSFKPKTAIALGNGRKVVARILRIEKLLFNSIPLMVLTGLIFPYLRSLLI